MSLYLVTGGAGFIGSHLCDALIARGDGVRVLDDFSSGERANVPARAELLIGDIADPDVAFEAARGITGCFHLAAVASVERGFNDWAGTHRTNMSGTIAIFDAARRHEKKISTVYASSAAVYGDCKTVPIPECAERRPLSAYGADKYGCELHAHVAGHVHGVPTMGLRFFNVYGPRQNPRSPYSGVISIFCDRTARGMPITIYGDGAQTRDFVHVSDVVAALLAAMRTASEAGPVVNVCTGQAASILELAHLIGDLTARRVEVRHMASRAGEIRHSLGDPSDMRRLLGLDRMVSLRDGIAALLAHNDARR